jgi:hypothetical protein
MIALKGKSRYSLLSLTLCVLVPAPDVGFRKG